MVNIKEFIMCKVIKFAYKLIHSNNENWNIIGRYWTKSFDQRYGTDFFLIQCSSLKNLKSGNMPEFYVIVISAYAYMQSKTKLNGIDAILNERILGNINIHYKHAPIMV